MTYERVRLEKKQNLSTIRTLNCKCNRTNAKGIIECRGGVGLALVPQQVQIRLNATWIASGRTGKLTRPYPEGRRLPDPDLDNGHTTNKQDVSG